MKRGNGSQRGYTSAMKKLSIFSWKEMWLALRTSRPRDSTACTSCKSTPGPFWQKMRRWYVCSSNLAISTWKHHQGIVHHTNSTKNNYAFLWFQINKELVLQRISTARLVDGISCQSDLLPGSSWPIVMGTELEWCPGQVFRCCFRRL